MKLKSILVGLVTVLGLSTIALSQAANSYYPPERINCNLVGSKVSCEGFNHQYLAEDTYTANFDGKDQVFGFASGAAYYNSDRSEVSVFYTYTNANAKNVKLKTVSTTIRPDFENGNWTKVAEDVYVCKSGYMHCPITSLPDTSKKA